MGERGDEILSPDDIEEVAGNSFDQARAVVERMVALETDVERSKCILAFGAAYGQILASMEGPGFQRQLSCLLQGVDFGRTLYKERRRV